MENLHDPSGSEGPEKDPRPLQLSPRGFGCAAIKALNLASNEELRAETSRHGRIALIRAALHAGAREQRAYERDLRLLSPTPPTTVPSPRK